MGTIYVSARKEGATYEEFKSIKEQLETQLGDAGFEVSVKFEE